MIDAQPTSFTWHEPRASWFAQIRPILQSWGMLSPGLYIKSAIGFVGASALGFLIVYLINPNVPPSPNRTAVIVGSLLFSQFLLLAMLAYFLTMVARVTISARGIEMVCKRTRLVTPDELFCIRVQQTAKGPFAIYFEYRNRFQAREAREIWLTSKIDPAALERFILDQGWPSGDTPTQPNPSTLTNSTS